MLQINHTNEKYYNKIEFSKHNLFPSQIRKHQKSASNDSISSVSSSSTTSAFFSSAVAAGAVAVAIAAGATTFAEDMVSHSAWKFTLASINMFKIGLLAAMSKAANILVIFFFRHFHFAVVQDEAAERHLVDRSLAIS